LRKFQDMGLDQQTRGKFYKDRFDAMMLIFQSLSESVKELRELIKTISIIAAAVVAFSLPLLAEPEVINNIILFKLGLILETVILLSSPLFLFLVLSDEIKTFRLMQNKQRELLIIISDPKKNTDDLEEKILEVNECLQKIKKKSKWDSIISKMPTCFFLIFAIGILLIGLSLFIG